MINKLINPFSILFLEDEKLIRENYVNYLKMFFKNVYEADNGEDAYKIYQNKKPEILILDINLPSMNGLELLKKIRTHDHTTKAIVLTAYSDIHYLLQAVELKLTKYLVKPVTKDELNDALLLAIGELTRFNITSKKIVTLKNNCLWNNDLKEFSCNDHKVKLTEKERAILELFFKNPNKTFTYDDIIHNVWNDMESDTKNIKAAVKTAIKNLRKKLPENTITNVYSIGYKIEFI